MSKHTKEKPAKQFSLSLVVYFGVKYIIKFLDGKHVRVFHNSINLRTTSPTEL